MTKIERPMFNPYSFPDEERHNIRRVSVQLGFLIEFGDDFAAAATLIQEIRRQMRRHNIYGQPEKNLLASRWKSVAARDGAVILYKIQDIIDNINTSLRDVPNFCALVDKKKKNAAARAFRLAFPDINVIRQAVTHTPDITKNPEKFSEHTMTGDYDDGQFLIKKAKHIIIHQSVSADVFTCSYRGKIYKYNINIEVSNKINAIIKDFIAAFDITSLTRKANDF